MEGKKNGGVTNGQSSGDTYTSTFRRSDVTQQPGLNILNQVTNLSQLSAYNTSFDPGLYVSSSSETHQHQADDVISAFSGLVVQSSSCDNASASVATTTTANGFNERRVSPPLHIPMQAQKAAQSNHNSPTVSPPPSSVMMKQQMPVVSHHQSQQISYQNASHHAQPMQQKPIQNGRVPATKHDNRKLFVGGLPNEGKFEWRSTFSFQIP